MHACRIPFFASILCRYFYRPLHWRERAAVSMLISREKKTRKWMGRGRYNNRRSVHCQTHTNELSFHTWGMTFKGKIVDKPYPFGLKNITFSSKYVCIVFFLLLFVFLFFPFFKNASVSTHVHFEWCELQNGRHGTASCYLRIPTPHDSEGTWKGVGRTAKPQQPVRYRSHALTQ